MRGSWPGPWKTRPPTVLWSACHPPCQASRTAGLASAFQGERRVLSWGPPQGAEAPQSLRVRGTQAGGGVWRSGSAPAPEALWVSVWLPPHPQSQAVSIFNCTLASLHQPQVVVFGHVGALLPGPLSFPAGPGGGGLICFSAGQAGGGQVVLGEPGPILSTAEVRKQSPQRIKGPS